MTSGLFDDPTQPERLLLPDAELQLIEHPRLPLPADELLQRLMQDTPWRAEKVTLYGKQHDQPRLSAWFGDTAARYAYSGLKLDPLPWTPLLLELKTAVEQQSETRFNSVLLNLYRNERDSMGMHSDDERELGPAPVIASLSLGATRTFILKHKTRPELKRVRIPLQTGSLLVMKGATQTHWRHGIDKERAPCGPRINLTFRLIGSPFTHSVESPRSGA